VAVGDAIQLLGSAAVPLSMVILGGTLATTPFRLKANWQLVTRSFVTKLILMPAATLGILIALDLPPELSMLGLFWVLQSAYPQASNLILQIRTYGGDRERVCAVLVVCYLGSLVTLPLWVGFWQYLRAG
jgi:predicted permease